MLSKLLWVEAVANFEIEFGTHFTGEPFSLRRASRMGTVPLAKRGPPIQLIEARMRET